ncbi:hypothetical protein ACI78V_13590 [Geodermatophilus sp. SYSU D00742]
MEWAIVSVVGFALVTGLVIALARQNTARWERDRRAARAALPPPEPSPRQLAAARLHAELVRRAPRLAEHLAHGRVALRRPHLGRGGTGLHLPQLSLRLPHAHMPHLPHGRVALHLPHLALRRPHLAVRRPRLPHLRRRGRRRTDA